MLSTLCSWCTLWILVKYSFVVALITGIFFWMTILILRQKLSPNNDPRRPLQVGFFHPYSTGGGGGERVLWTFLAAVQKTYRDADITLYTHFTDSSLAASVNTDDGRALKELVKRKFGIALLEGRNINVVQLEGIHWVEASSYPRVTLLLQSLGAIPLGYEAISQHNVDIFIDSMGYAFTYPLVKLLSPTTSVVSYTHYPTVSTDMLSAVRSGEAFNNASAIARSRLLTEAKIAYYRLFSVLYGWCGRFSCATMVNSSWTKGHIAHIWEVPTATSSLHCVYPPCDCTQLRRLKRSDGDGDGGVMKVISVAQFRPEKNHALQVEALRIVNSKLKERGDSKRVRLELVGGVRDDADRARVTELQALSTKLGVEHEVGFHVDLPYEDLKRLLSESTAGIHTMWNEHFGIGIVEYMASGCIPVAHRSGGPLADIVEAGVSGFLAETAEEYAGYLLTIVDMSPTARAAMSEAARERSLRFNEEQFNQACLKVVSEVVSRRS